MRGTDPGTASLEKRVWPGQDEYVKKKKMFFKCRDEKKMPNITFKKQLLRNFQYKS